MFRGFLLDLIFKFLFRRMGRQVIHKAKVQSVKAYLQLLQGVRLSLVGILSLLVLVQIVVFGLVITVAAALWLSPLESQLKAWVALGVGAGLCLIPLILVGWILSEGLWYKFSGAEKMVEDLIDEEAA